MLVPHYKCVTCLQDSAPPVAFVRYTTKADAEYARAQMQDYPQAPPPSTLCA
jgi:hypothetical protein